MYSHYYSSPPLTTTNSNNNSKPIAAIQPNAFDGTHLSTA